MHRAALTRETTRVESTSVLEKEISVFSHFDRLAKIFESQLSRSKSSNQKRSPTRYSSPGKLRIFPPVLPTSVANVKKPTAPPRFSAVSRQNSAGSSSCALRNHCMACTIVRRQASVNRLPRGGSPSLRRHARDGGHVIAWAGAWLRQRSMTAAAVLSLTPGPGEAILVSSNTGGRCEKKTPGFHLDSLHGV